ncbi:hypothetical protein [Thermoclostridium caenicola]|uniref:Uncharacterized protein n=1 Tax=Thermoclostridium caenicola TaxID=659425 RepID=A0A1M6BJ15_9FIRM|nr:hypothetical protein [Thermoclostridium caenicola]SHI48483.1 hypothetical protein SAMN05444373_100318 [Thermoclostridium caenicola]
MYLEEYSLYAVPAILVTGAVTWIYLRMKGRAEKSNVRALIFSTAVAIFIALLVPAIARLYYHETGLPAMASAAAAFVSLVLLAAAAYVLGTRLLKMKTQSAELRESFGYAGEEAAAAQEEGAASPEEQQEEASKTEKTGDEEGSDSLPLMDDAERLCGADGAESQESPEDRETEEVDTLQNIDKIGVEGHVPVQENLDELLRAAMDSKMRGDLQESVSCYRRALVHIQDKELMTMVILDLCGLAKLMKNTRLVRDILDSEHGKMLDDAIKGEILANI